MRIKRHTIRFEIGTWPRTERWAEARANMPQEKKRLKAMGFEYSPREGKYVKLIWRKEIEGTEAI